MAWLLKEEVELLHHGNLITRQVRKVGTLNCIHFDDALWLVGIQNEQQHATLTKLDDSLQPMMKVKQKYCWPKGK
jgi:hypothetical protein